MVSTWGSWDFEHRGAISGQILDIRDHEGCFDKRVYIIYRYNGEAWKVWETRELKKAMERAGSPDVGDKLRSSLLNKIHSRNGIAEYDWLVVVK